MRSSSSLLISTAAGVIACAVATQAVAQQSSSSSASAMSSPADNSGINQRDRSSQTIKPTDQPNDKADITLAAAVRRAIVKDDTLSTTAHNIKLIAAKGAVTLRGPVKSADEKTKIEADVKSVAGVSSVDNQLDVKN